MQKHAPCTSEIITKLTVLFLQLDNYYIDASALLRSKHVAIHILQEEEEEGEGEEEEEKEEEEVGLDKLC